MKTLSEEYEQYLKEQKLSENTRMSYLRDLDAFVDYAKKRGFKDVLKLDRTKIEAYTETMRENGKADSTISRTVSSLRKFYQCMLRNGRISFNPAYGIEVPHVKKKLPEVLSAREIVKLLNQPKTTDLKGIRDKAMLELLYATGMKVSEIINLTIRDMDIRAGMVNCNFGKSPRYIPVGRVALEAVDKYINKARPYMVHGPKVKNLFVNCSGTPLTRQGFWKILRYYAQSAGIKTELNAQTLRNSFALHLLENGADINAVSEMLGHGDVVTTRIYDQILKSNIKKIYKKAHPRA